jgi:magnesium transporter
MLIAKGRVSDERFGRALVYHGGGIETDVSLEHLSERAAVSGTLVWLDVNAPCEDDLDRLQHEFGLHPLAVEDLRRPQQRPKVDAYEGTLLVVLFDVGQDARGHLRLNEVAVFIGSGFIITIHARPVPALRSVAQRWLQQPQMVEPSPPGFLLYRIAIALIDEYFPITDQLDLRVERFEDDLFERFDPSSLQALLRMRRDLVQLRRSVAPQRDVFTTLARHDDDVLDARTDAYFADIVDLVLRLMDTIDTMRERLGTALDSYLTLQSNALNETMKRLTALTVMIMLPTVIAGVYGMNFDRMPELHWDLGYPFALLLMTAVVFSAWLVFRRKDWL